MDESKAGQRRHPAEVTSDRLLADYERWFARLTGAERDAISVVREALYRIEEEDQAATADGQ